MSMLEQFLAADLIGGTLVEFRDGAKFRREFGRATILSIDHSGGGMKFITDGEAHLVLSKLGMSVLAPSIDKVGDIWYLDFSNCPCYAMAEAGVKIPKPNQRRFQLGLA